MKIFFWVGVLKVTDEKSRIRIRKSVVRIHGSAYVSQSQHYSKLRDFGSRKVQKGPIYILEHRILTKRSEACRGLGLNTDWIAKSWLDIKT